MSKLTEWTGIEPLPSSPTTLLEASAGTGKTWQIEGLVVRLVAEQGVSIDRILVITFTNAATAELRDRVRRRLVKARDALSKATSPKDDPIIEQLWNDEDSREERRTRLAAALASFDLAPISTIHGFSQRTLDQLAFESGQEPGLELVADPSPIIQRLVDDEIARVYAEATEDDLAVLQDMGWTPAGLAEVAKAMTRAVAPVVDPEVVGAGVSPFEAVHQWHQFKSDLLCFLDSEGGRAAQNALRAELTRSKDKRVDGRKMKKDFASNHLPRLAEWLQGPALRSSRCGKSPKVAAVGKLSLESLEAAWKDPGKMAEFEGYPLFERVSELIERQDTLWPSAVAGFAARIRGLIDRELVRTGQLTYDAILSRLNERVAEQGGASGQLASALRSRYEVALVDEFQDTDGAQWPVMQAVFAQPGRRLFVIGDPKQAIYAFRGADVHVYLEAARSANTRATMRTNRRSDGPLVRAMNHLWAEGSNPFELDDVDYVCVDAAPGRDEAGIRGLPQGNARERRPLELRWLDGTAIGAEGRVIHNKALGEDATARSSAAEVVRLLAGETQIWTARDGQDEPEWSTLLPGDVAVLVRTNRQAERVRLHLERLNVPSVSPGRTSVMMSPALGWISAWMDALADPSRDRPARALVTTPLFGWSASELHSALASVAAMGLDGAASNAELGDHRWHDLLQTLRGWATLWSRHGFMRAFEACLNDTGVVERLLQADQGERYATDLRHLAELCHAEERRTRLGPSGLASWLRASRNSASDNDDATALRLESDARAVQIVTIHKSKGLEYPVVLLPFGWADRSPTDKHISKLWHADHDGQPELQLCLHPVGTDARKDAAAGAGADERREQLRLLYVALTRARHHCIAWMGPIGKTAADADSYALGRTALRARDTAGHPDVNARIPAFDVKRSKKADVQAEVARNVEATWQTVKERLDQLTATSGGTVGWSVVPFERDTHPLTSTHEAHDALVARPWPSDRALVTAWQVSSYSAMVAGRTFDASEPQRVAQMRSAAPMLAPSHTDDSENDPRVEVQVDLSEPVMPDSPLDQPIATRDMHGGTEVGTWVHAVFEHLDFQACRGQDGREVGNLISEQGSRHGVRSPQQHAILESVLPAILDTALDGGATALPRGTTLRDIRRDDRIDELQFDLRLGHGNRWNTGLAGREGRIDEAGARAALRSRLGVDDWGGAQWLRAVLDRAGDGARGVLPSIAGILTGLIDLVFRVPIAPGGSQDGHRYFVADYKTNRIGAAARRRDSRAMHYTRPWMDWEMARHGYHLQGLLYTVALHRMLRQRLPDYDYERHVGGHLYLFLRGMAGENTPRDAGLSLGVYADRWPASVVLGLDAALSGRPTDEVREIVEGARAPGVQP